MNVYRIERNASTVYRNQLRRRSLYALSDQPLPSLYTASYGLKATSSREHRPLCIAAVINLCASSVTRQLFGEDEDGAELDDAEKQGENGMIPPPPGFEHR